MIFFEEMTYALSCFDAIMLSCALAIVLYQEIFSKLYYV